MHTFAMNAALHAARAIVPLSASSPVGVQFQRTAVEPRRPPPRHQLGSHRHRAEERDRHVAAGRRRPADAGRTGGDGSESRNSSCRTLLLARVGQPVEFRNSEDMPHNVSVTRRESGSEVFNVGTEPHQKYVHTFDRVGQFDVKCDIHEGMEATVIVARGPMTTIAGDDGRFSFPNVAFGSYKVSLTFRAKRSSSRSRSAARAPKSS